MTLTDDEKKARAQERKKLRQRSAIRTIKLRVGKIDGDAKQMLERWQRASELTTIAANVLYQQWLVWHVSRRNAVKVADDNRKYIEWSKAEKKTRGVAPKNRVQCFDPDLLKIISDEIGVMAPGLNAQSKGELIQRHNKDFSTRAASKGMGKGWKDVLLCRQRMPSFTRLLPIPLKASAIEIYKTGDSKKPWSMKLRVDRYETTTAIGGSKLASHEDCFAFYVKRNDRMAWGVLKGIVSGEVQMKGSALWYSKKKHQWHVLLCYQRAKKDRQEFDPEKVAYLRPGKKSPWLLRQNGRTKALDMGGRGLDVQHVRLTVMGQRFGRQHNYRYAGGARKGHGYDRANKLLWKLSQRWKEFVSRHNHVSTRRAIDWSCSSNCGTIVYFKPREHLLQTRRLATAGKQGDMRESSSWEWFQFENYLRQKCDDHGIKLVVRECSCSAVLPEAVGV